MNMKRMNIMKCRGWLMLLLLWLSVGAASAQRSFSGLFYNEEFNLSCELNLYEDDIPVPGLEIDTCYGFLKGRINGMWVILKVKELSETRAVVRAVSERGSDAQDVELTLNKDGQLEMRQTGGVSIKGVEKGKYQKLPKVLVLQAVQ